MRWKHEGRTIRETMRTSQPPIAVYDAWADPGRYAGWFVDRAEGHTVPGATVTWYFDDFGYELPVEVVEALPGQKLVFRDRVPGAAARITEIRIAREGDQTRVDLRNSGFPTGADFEENFQACVRGWTLALATLKHYLERHAGQRRTAFLRMRPATFEYERLSDLYGPGLARWFPRAGEVGPVLANAEPESLLHWSRIRGLLALKAFPMGPKGRMVALQVNAWDLPKERGDEIGTLLDEALDRLVAELA